MRILFDMLHPAHFHLFKNAIALLKSEGHEVEIIARQKDCLPELLDASGLEYTLILRKGTAGLFILAMESIKAAWIAARRGWKNKIDVMAGTSISIGPAARVCGAKSCLFEEDDASIVPLFAKFGYPIAHYVVTPKSLAWENHGRKHITYPGFHELAYLHPDCFKPDKSILKDLGIEEDQRYFVVRLVALKAHHDIGEKGLGTQQARQIIEKLSAHGRVFISAESTVDPSLEKYLLPTPPDRILDVLAFADMLIGDSQTMSIEAGILGIPTIRCNSFVGRITVLKQLDDYFKLTCGFLPADFDKLMEFLDQWLAMPDLKAQWQAKRDRMLSECVNLTDWMLELFTDLAEGKDRRKTKATG